MTPHPELPLNTLLSGDCLDILPNLPEKSVDVVFADPPYNLRLGGELHRPNMTKVDAVDDDWDKFETPAAYDAFTRAWLSACRRALKNTGTLWVIGSYHNVYRVGTALMDTDYWILNEIVWEKSNPMPHFRGTRFTNAHETLIWAQKCKGERYTFNYHALKSANEDKQMRSVWELPICSGSERLTVNGEKVHATQKPEALLYRVLISSTRPGDVVLDPFFGTGTTGAVAKKLRRAWIGIERDPLYVAAAQARIDAVSVPDAPDEAFQPGNKVREKRVPFLRLLETGLLRAGEALRFGHTEHYATVGADGVLRLPGDRRGSIHQLGSELQGAPCNGWDHWYYRDPDGGWTVIDALRRRLRAPQGV